MLSMNQDRDCDDGGRQTERPRSGGLAFSTPCLVLGRTPAAGVPRYVHTRSAWFLNGQPKALTPTYPFFLDSRKVPIIFGRGEDPEYRDCLCITTRSKWSDI